jgi:hypothetical protein
MRIEFHDLDLCEPFEYWCATCKTLNLCFVPLTRCPVCQVLIVERGPIGSLDDATMRGDKRAS